MAKNSNKKESDQKNGKGFKNLMTAKSGLGLAVRIIILIIIPYAYLMLCGLIFDWWLHMYNMTDFIFYSLIVLAVAALVMIGFCIYWFVKRDKKQ